MKYFTIDRIRNCSRHLENFHSSWIIPSFVFAANGVNSNSSTNLADHLGTDAFLDRFFSGELLGLPALPDGNNTIRPRFKDLMVTLKRENKESDYILHQDTKLWANAYSSRGYREMANRGELERQGTSGFKLTDKFAPAFEAKIPTAFKYEEFLVWLFAFTGFPDQIGGWTDLHEHLCKNVLNLTADYAPEFRSRFKVRADPPVPWPDQLLSARPENGDYLAQLAPSLVKDSTAYLQELPEDNAVRKRIENALNQKGVLNFLFYGPPGTGKTYHAHKIARLLAEGDEARITYLQFHPSTSYDDFVEGYVPAVSKTGNAVSYEARPKHFLKVCERAAKDSDKYYVIVIDEISRGDPNRVFGEILTYIEPEYRNRKFKLAYSGNDVSVPPNVIVLATANPYDRSVVELDDALVRRFYMVNFPPDRKALSDHLTAGGIDAGFSGRLLRLFDVLNSSLPFGFGHAFLFGLSSVDDVQDLWNSKIAFMLKRTFAHEPERFLEIERQFNELFKPEADTNTAAPQGA